CYLAQQKSSRSNKGRLRRSARSATTRRPGATRAAGRRVGERPTGHRRAWRRRGRTTTGRCSHVFLVVKLDAFKWRKYWRWSRFLWKRLTGLVLLLLVQVELEEKYHQVEGAGEGEGRVWLNGLGPE
uniref:Uncharacterized protein n=1 Tax=Leersia perrieri TaxID=77586 RepID=A0A0D9XCY1_9ORYZ